MTTEKEALLPCPFCGGTEGYVERMTICVYQYICDCGAVGPPVEKLEYEDHEGTPAKDAIKAWNTRADKGPEVVSVYDLKLELEKTFADCIFEIANLIKNDLLSGFTKHLAVRYPNGVVIKGDD